MTLDVRDYRASDRPALEEAIATCGAFTPPEVVIAHEVMDGALSGEYPHLVVARGDEVLGYVCMGPTPMTESTWTLYWICVHPNAQGTGAGQALQRAAEDYARARGGRRLVLETSGKPEYDRQRRFYLRAGYVERGRIPDFYRDGDDGVYYVKDL